MSYDEYAPQVSSNSLAALTKLANEQAAKELEVAELQQKLEQAQRELRDIAEVRMPELMDELGMSNFTTTGGYKISIEQQISASIPKAKADEAFDWLDKNEYGGMVKREFAVSFGRDQEAWARKFAADLKKRKQPLNVSVRKKVEPMTLKKFVTDQLMEGNDIPLDLFGVFTRRVAKISHKG